MKEQYKGKYIVIEGGDGCGKSLQSDMLTEYLERKNLKVMRVREPGGTILGGQIRKLLKDPESVDPPVPIAELFLFEAGRVQLAQRVIRPALEEGLIVVTDRNHYATIAYQGFGRGLDLCIINILNEYAMIGIKPDVGFIIDIDPKQGLEKVATEEFEGKDRFELEKIDFHERVRWGYLSVAREEENVFVIPYIKDGAEEMQREIRKIVDLKLGLSP